jgi:hypothetical protein
MQFSPILTLMPGTEYIRNLTRRGVHCVTTGESTAQFERSMTMHIAASVGQISLRDKSYQQRYACHGERTLFIAYRDRCDCAGMKQSNRFRAELRMLVAAETE